eukprot:maker-scaffold_26-snap-gene-1.0-mRNA-1 protein AED:0.09 eAED:0.10 QI:0/0/0/1/1/1/2/0/348
MRSRSPMSYKEGETKKISKDIQSASENACEDQDGRNASPSRQLTLGFLSILCFLLTAHSIYVLDDFSSKLRADENTRATVLVVWACGWITCAFTALGSLPFYFFSSLRPSFIAVSNSVACGMMSAASLSLIFEACAAEVEFQGENRKHYFVLIPSAKTLIGVWLGFAFIKGSESFLSDFDKTDLLSSLVSGEEKQKNEKNLSTNLKRMLLVFGVMLLHSFAEGAAIGVSHHTPSLGNYISTTLAVHNVPEGLALSLVFCSRGSQNTDKVLVSLLCILSSLPQPLMAVPAFIFVGYFKGIVAIALGFAAGAMGYVAVFELFEEAKEVLGFIKALFVSFLACCVQGFLSD